MRDQGVGCRGNPKGQPGYREEAKEPSHTPQEHGDKTQDLRKSTVKALRVGSDRRDQGRDQRQAAC